MATAPVPGSTTGDAAEPREASLLEAGSLSTIDAAELLQITTDRAYEDLYRLTGALGRETLDGRRDALIQYVRTQRTRFLQAYAVLRWLSDRPKLVPAAQRALEAAQKHTSEVETAQDRLFNMHASLFGARQPRADLPTALQMLTGAGYTSFPTGIRNCGMEVALRPLVRVPRPQDLPESAVTRRAKSRVGMSDEGTAAAAAAGGATSAAAAAAAASSSTEAATAQTSAAAAAAAAAAADDPAAAAKAATQALIEQVERCVRKALAWREPLPAGFASARLQGGRLRLECPARFALTLTLDSRKIDAPWVALKVEVFVGAKAGESSSTAYSTSTTSSGSSTGSSEGALAAGTPVLDERHAAYLLGVVQKGMDKAAAAANDKDKDEEGGGRPLAKAYTICREFCSSLQLSTLEAQARALSQRRGGPWGGNSLEVRRKAGSSVLDLCFWPTEYRTAMGPSGKDVGASDAASAAGGVRSKALTAAASAAALNAAAAAPGAGVNGVSTAAKASRSADLPAAAAGVGSASAGGSSTDGHLNAADGSLAPSAAAAGSGGGAALPRRADGSFSRSFSSAEAAVPEPSGCRFLRLFVGEEDGEIHSRVGPLPGLLAWNDGSLPAIASAEKLAADLESVVTVKPDAISCQLAVLAAAEAVARAKLRVTERELAAALSALGLEAKAQVVRLGSDRVLRLLVAGGASLQADLGNQGAAAPGANFDTQKAEGCSALADISVDVCTGRVVVRTCDHYMPVTKRALAKVQEALNLAPSAAGTWTASTAASTSTATTPAAGASFSESRAAKERLRRPLLSSLQEALRLLAVEGVEASLRCRFGLTPQRRWRAILGRQQAGRSMSGGRSVNKIAGVDEASTYVAIYERYEHGDVPRAASSPAAGVLSASKQQQPLKVVAKSEPELANGVGISGGQAFGGGGGSGPRGASAIFVKTEPKAVANAFAGGWHAAEHAPPAESEQLRWFVEFRLDGSLDLHANLLISSEPFSTSSLRPALVAMRPIDAKAYLEALRGGRSSARLAPASLEVGEATDAATALISGKKRSLEQAEGDGGAGGDNHKLLFIPLEQPRPLKSLNGSAAPGIKGDGISAARAERTGEPQALVGMRGSSSGEAMRVILEAANALVPYSRLARTLERARVDTLAPPSDVRAGFRLISESSSDDYCLWPLRWRRASVPANWRGAPLFAQSVHLRRAPGRNEAGHGDIWEFQILLGEASPLRECAEEFQLQSSLPSTPPIGGRAAVELDKVWTAVRSVCVTAQRLDGSKFLRLKQKATSARALSWLILELPAALSAIGPLAQRATALASSIATRLPPEGGIGRYYVAATGPLGVLMTFRCAVPRGFADGSCLLLTTVGAAAEKVFPELDAVLAPSASASPGESAAALDAAMAQRLALLPWGQPPLCPVALRELERMISEYRDFSALISTMDLVLVPLAALAQRLPGLLEPPVELVETDGLPLAGVASEAAAGASSSGAERPPRFRLRAHAPARYRLEVEKLQAGARDVKRTGGLPLHFLPSGRVQLGRTEANVPAMLGLAVQLAANLSH